MALLFQQTLPGLALIATETRRAVGVIGELMAVELFQQVGYGVVRCRNRSRRGDLLVIDKLTGEIFRVEVKTARLGKDKKYRFTLLKAGCTDYHDAQYVLLLPLSPTGYPTPYLIPVDDIHQPAICMYGLPESYTGKWISYRVDSTLKLGVN